MLKIDVQTGTLTGNGPDDVQKSAVCTKSERSESDLPTLKDIAAVCNVHISTVSRALNNYPDIPEETRKRILEAAKLMGYKAGRVTGHKTKTSRIGVLLQEGSGSAVFYEILHEIWKYLLPRGYDLVLLHPMRAEGGVSDAPGYLAKARVLGLDGVLILMHIDECGLYQTDRHAAVRDLLISEIPVVVVDSSVGICSCILPGYDEGMHTLVGHIRQKGHDRIALIHGHRTAGNGSEENLRDWNKLFSDAVEVYRGSVHENLVKCVKEGSVAESFSATMELLQKWNWIPPTCIIYTDEALLRGGMEAAAKCGLRIPEDISVAAIRFTTQREASRCRVTSWCFDPALIAEEAVKKILTWRKTAGFPGNRIGFVSGTLAAGSTVKPICVPEYE